MSSDGKLYRLPTVGVGTSTTSTGPPATRQFSDLNNNQLNESKSIAINSTSSKRPNNRGSTSAPLPAVTTRRLEEVQVSLVINRPTESKPRSDSDPPTDIDDIKAPFKTGSESKTGTNVRRSSANLAVDESALGIIETPDAKIVNRKSNRKNLFKSLFCCFSSQKRAGSKRASLKNGNLANNLTLFNDNYSPAVDKDAPAAVPSTAPTAKLITNEANSSTQINAATTNTNASSSNESAGVNFSKSNINSNNANLNTNTINNNINNSNNNNNNINNSNSSNVNTSSSPTTASSSYVGSNLINTFYANDHQNTHEKFLLPPVRPSDLGKKCLIIDLDETLVHSSFKQVHNADFIVPVEIDGVVHQVYVLKRPHVDEFLKRMGELYECVLFTASLAKYADPVADLLDKWGVFRSRLFREACVYYRGNYVKDLSRLGRDLNKVLILDNSPASYIFHPDNAIACNSWFDDPNDTELRDLISYFERLAAVDSVYSILKQPRTHHHHHGNQLSHLIAAACAGGSYAEDNDGTQVVPASPNSIIYQVQQSAPDSTPTRPLTATSSAINNLNYLINENKMLLSIDMMMASKQQQLNKSPHK